MDCVALWVTECVAGCVAGCVAERDELRFLLPHTAGVLMEGRFGRPGAESRIPCSAGNTAGLLPASHPARSGDRGARRAA